MDKIVLVGSGQHAECILALIEEEQNFDVHGLLDINKTGEVLSYPILGNDDLLNSLSEKGVEYAFPGALLGSNTDTRVGKKITNKIEKSNLKLPNLISSRALVRKNVELAFGILIQPLSVIDTSAKIGKGVMIGNNVLVGHHSIIEDYVVFAGGVISNARVRIGEGAFIGMGAVINADIGAYSKISPGSIVMESIPPNSIAFGNPLKIMPRFDLNSRNMKKE